MAIQTRLGQIGFGHRPYAGFVAKAEADEGGAGWPEEGRTRRVILPDGRRLNLTDREIAEVRRQIDVERFRQQAELEAKSARKQKAVKRKEIQQIEVAGEIPIVLPPRVQGLPGWDEERDLAAAIHQMLRVQENDALMLLLMVS